jgi:2'-5' RNA ligase
MTGNLFVAVDLSDEDRHAIANTLSERDLAKRIPGRRVKPPNWHITLCFIGEATEVESDRLAERLESTIEAKRFAVTVGSIGGFPRAAKASVIFLSIDDPSANLAALASVCTEAAVDIGFDPDDRRFVPHLTLSRVRPPQAIHRLVETESLDIPLRVGALTVFRTVAERGGVRYEPVHTIGFDA